MSETLFVSISAVIPLVIYMIVGIVTSKTKLLSSQNFQGLSKIAYTILMPALMFFNFYQMDFTRDIRFSVILLSLVGSILLVVLLMIFVPLFVKENARRGTTMQAIFRSSTVLFAIPLAESLFGAEGRGFASLLVACTVPVNNIASVVVMERYRGQKVNFWKLLLKIVTNPLIICAVIGAVFSLVKLSLPEFIVKPVGVLANMTTPVSLIALGGTMQFKKAGKNILNTSVTCALRLVLIPLVFVLISRVLKFTGLETIITCLVFAAPVSVSLYPMAQNMDGDADLAAQQIAFSSVICILTLFLWIVALKSILKI